MSFKIRCEKNKSEKRVALLLFVIINKNFEKLSRKP